MSRGLIDDSPARARRRDLETLIHSEQASWIGIRDSGTRNGSWHSPRWEVTSSLYAEMRAATGGARAAVEGARGR